MPLSVALRSEGRPVTAGPPAWQGLRTWLQVIVLLLLLVIPPFFGLGREVYAASALLWFSQSAGALAQSTGTISGRTTNPTTGSVVESIRVGSA